VDLEIVATHLRWQRWIAGVVTVAAALALLEIPASARELAITTRVPFVIIALWPVVFAIWLRLGTAQFVDARLKPASAAVLLFMPTMFATLGACSDRSVSPAYAIMLLMPPGWGHLFPANRTMALSIALSPPLLRALTVPHASARSIAVAALIGASVTAAFLTFGWRRRAVRRRERRALLREALGAPDAKDGASRWAALRLHDRLSGVLFLAQARATIDDAGEVVKQGRIALGLDRDDAPLSAHALAGALQTFAPQVGVALTIAVTTADDVARPAWRELHDLLVEQIANHARHGERGAAMRVTLERVRDEARVRLDVEGPSPLGSSGRRGRRNLKLRVEALGGDLSWRPRRRSWTLEIGVPIGEPRLRGSWWIVEALAIAAMPIVGWVAFGGGAVALFFMAMTLWFGTVHILDLRNYGAAFERRRADLRAEIADAVPQALDSARAALEPQLSSVERAATAHDETAYREAIDTLATALGAELARLEAPTSIRSALA
jgi:hypothetical protein